MKNGNISPVIQDCTKLAIEGEFVRYPVMSQTIEMEESDGAQEEF